MQTVQVILKSRETLYDVMFPLGKVLSVRSRQVPHYAVVPVFGCPVNRTVNDIVTNAWLVSYSSDND